MSNFPWILRSLLQALQLPLSVTQACNCHFSYSLEISNLSVPFPLLLLILDYYTITGFPDSSVGQESTCNAGDPSLIPGSERSPGEGKGYPLRYSWASLVAQLVKNLPAMQETWVWSLGWENPLEKGKVTHSSILAWKFHEPYSPWGCEELDVTEWLLLSLFITPLLSFSC